MQTISRVASCRISKQINPKPRRDQPLVYPESEVKLRCNQIIDSGAVSLAFSFLCMCDVALVKWLVTCLSGKASAARPPQLGWKG